MTEYEHLLAVLRQGDRQDPEYQRNIWWTMVLLKSTLAIIFLIAYCIKTIRIFEVGSSLR